LKGEFEFWMYLNLDSYQFIFKTCTVSMALQFKILFSGEHSGIIIYVLSQAFVEIEEIPVFVFFQKNIQKMEKF